MLWLHNSNKEFKFYQVFTCYDIVHDGNIVLNDNSTYNTNNIIYSFEINPGTDDYMYDFNGIIQHKSFGNNQTHETFTFDVKVFDNIMNWTNTMTNKQQTFSTKMTFINPEEHKLGLPVFCFNYKEINKNRMPILINKTYDLSSQYTFVVYKINEHTQFIIETETKTKIKKKYFITNDLESIKKYFITNDLEFTKKYNNL
jgi:hypothetical protein